MLLQQPPDDDYAIIGGHVAFGETAEEALRREYGEELHADIVVDRLLAVGELFFPWGERRCHQIALCYRIRLAAPDSLPAAGRWPGYDERGGVRTNLSYVWVPLSQLNRLKLCPPELIPLLQEEPEGVASFISRS